jgi:hypothetical protein
VGPAAPEVRAARRLLRDKEPLAQAVSDALYAEDPSLMERHGARGREKCLQDMRYNIEHLIPAVELGDGLMFAGYVEWLDTLLRARHVATRDIVRCLELLGDEGARRYPREESEAITRILRAGLRVLARA